MKSPLETLLGKSASWALLYLVHYEEGYPLGIAKDLGLQKTAVQRQCAKLEGAGFLVSRALGRTRVYRFNRKSPAARKLEEFVEVFYDSMPLEERERIFAARRRPRRPGKPVRGEN